MCQGDELSCPDVLAHRAAFLRGLRNEVGRERRTVPAIGAGAGGGLLGTAAAGDTSRRRRHTLPARSDTVHWGYFSRDLAPRIEVDSGDVVTVETLTHHANDAADLMVLGDPGAESVFAWTKGGKAVDRRGAGSMDASQFGRGAGEGLGVHICTGPIAVRGAQPGDILEIRILDVAPRPSAAPGMSGRSFGSNAAAAWGYHYNDLLEEPKPREVVTIYEVDWSEPRPFARAHHSYRWTPQTDPSGVVHATIDYPGVPVDPSTVRRRDDVLRGIRIPVRPHFGVVALAPAEPALVSSIPPGHFGGNIDDWRIGAGATLFLPVSVEGALLSVGDPHASQGDSELCGTAIECSLTGVFQLILHKKADLAGSALEGLDYPMLETKDEWLVHGFSFANYLKELGPEAQSAIYSKSSIDLAMKDAFRKMRQFLMSTQKLTEDEAVSLMSIAVDFGVTQVVDGNWGVHAVVKKDVFAGRV